MTIRARLFFLFWNMLSQLVQKSRALGGNARGELPWQECEDRKPTQKSIWIFHGASVGELETLAPLIEASQKRGVDVGVTYFSNSARSWMDAYVKTLVSAPVFAGPCPAEVDWPEFLEKFKIEKIWVAKYEAWPGLWMAARNARVPLVLIQAEWRSSLLWITRLFRWLGMSLPKLLLTSSSAERLRIVSAHIPSAESLLAQDPRLVRIQSRIALSQGLAQGQPQGNSENNPKSFLNYLPTSIDPHSLPKPWLFFGSAWREDLDLFSKVVHDDPSFFQGTVFVFPHSLAPENLYLMKQVKIPRLYFINQMGILLESYRFADWVWVGGGFGAGVHSTLEPGFLGLPLACGPARSERFPEIESMCQTGQLSIVRTTQDVQAWLRQAPLWLRSQPVPVDDLQANIDRIIVAGEKLGYSKIT